MKFPALFVPGILLAALAASPPAPARGQQPNTAKIQSAKTVFFDDQTGDAAVGGAALAELKKWGRFQIVQQQSAADLIVLLSIDPYHAGSAIMADGKLGETDADGHVEPVPVTKHKKSGSSRDAYLTVVEPKTNDALWSDSHVWGGVLTGENSAGERLVKSLEREVGK